MNEARAGWWEWARALDERLLTSPCEEPTMNEELAAESELQKWTRRSPYSEMAAALALRMAAHEAWMREQREKNEADHRAYEERVRLEEERRARERSEMEAVLPAPVREWVEANGHRLLACRVWKLTADAADATLAAVAVRMLDAILDTIDEDD